MQNISFVRYSPTKDHPSRTTQLIEAYREVFANGPWHEWLKCSHCQQYWGKKDADMLAQLNFQHCSKPLIEFWPHAQVMTDLRHEIVADASCWLALVDRTVIGFCWGYPIDIATLETKLGLSLPMAGDTKIAYHDEVGIMPNYRGKKIAKSMISLRLADFLDQKLKIGIVRTRQYPEPSITFSWYTEKLGYEIMAQYPEDDGRVILSRKLHGLEKLL